MRIKDVQYIYIGIPSDPGVVFDLDVLKAIRISGIVN